MRSVGRLGERTHFLGLQNFVPRNLSASPAVDRSGPGQARLIEAAAPVAMGRCTLCKPCTPIHSYSVDWLPQAKRNAMNKAVVYFVSESRCALHTQTAALELVIKVYPVRRSKEHLLEREVGGLLSIEDMVGDALRRIASWT